MKTGIIFDMDGTLWDSTENIAMSWDVVVQREKPGLRRITTKDIQGVVGHTMKELEQMLFPMLEEKEAGELPKDGEQAVILEVNSRRITSGS